jgi:hypothetical protein
MKDHAVTRRAVKAQNQDGVVLVDGLEVRRTLEISVDKALARKSRQQGTKNSQAGRRQGTGKSADAGYRLARPPMFFATFRNHRSPMVLRYSRFLVRCASAGPRNVASDPTCVERPGRR